MKTVKQGFSEGDIARAVEENRNGVYMSLWHRTQYDVATTEDVTQETMIRVIKAMRKGAYKPLPGHKIGAWMNAVAYNLLIDHYRKKNRAPSTPMPNMPQSIEAAAGTDTIFEITGNYTESYEDQLVRADPMDKVRIAIERLPERQKEVVYMRIDEDLSFLEIARITKVSINTAIGRYRYARIAIKEMLGEAAEHTNNAAQRLQMSHRQLHGERLKTVKAVILSNQ